VENYILEKECKAKEIDYTHSCVTFNCCCGDFFTTSSSFRKRNLKREFKYMFSPIA
jgi:hypothetical protein